MVETRQDIIIRIINKILGAGDLVKQQKLMTGLNRATQSISRSTEVANQGWKKSTIVTGNLNKAGKVQVKTTETISKFQDKGAIATERLAVRQRFLRTWSDKLNVSSARVNKIMGQQGLIFDKNNNLTDLGGRRINNLNKSMISGKKATMGFNFSWLSVMFAGMALYRVFGGILRQQMELWGIMEGFSAMLMLIMIPVMEVLLAILWPVMEWFMNLPDEIKAVIGWWVIIGAAIGGIAMVIGMVMLALGGLAGLFGVSSAVIAAAIGAIILIIMGIVTVIYGVITIVKYWGKDWARVIRGVIMVLVGLSLIIIGIAILIGSWPLALVAAGILIIAGIVWLVSKIIKHWDKIKEVSWNVLKAIGGFFKKWFWDKPKEWLDKLFGWVKDIWGKIKGIFTGGKKATESSVGMPSRQFGGPIPVTGPYLLHRGEHVIPARGRAGGGEGGIVVSPIYNINVSDKEEMEKILRDNNLKLVEEVKRQIAI